NEHDSQGEDVAQDLQKGFHVGGGVETTELRVPQVFAPSPFGPGRRESCGKGGASARPSPHVGARAASALVAAPRTRFARRLLFMSPAQEIARRRTFAIISHPDAGKTTLTEKFLLYGNAIH